ncbi:MAG TPA: hypothetical protein VNY84_01465, partial [Acidimicrobiales bacterium]|nr:hypothetical protein [Acidimicrobiales bacterium]
MARALAAAAISVVALPVVATVAIGAGFSSAPAGATNNALSCAPGTIYNLTTSGGFYALNTSTSADTPAAPPSVGAGEQSPNGLAISSDGGTVFAVDQFNTGTSGSSDTTTVDMENVATASIQTFTNMPATGIGSEDVIAGGVDPVNGDYYYGGWNGPQTEFILFSFNPTTHTAAEAGTITPANGGAWGSGDLAFDGSGNLYVLAGTDTSGEILAVPGPIPTSGTAALTNKVLGSFSGSGSIDGVAFAADGTLYAEDLSGDFYAINPNTGAVTTLAHQTGISNPDDLGSCAYNGSLKVEKDIVGRVGASDQFTVSIAQGATTLSTGTTSGTGTGTQTGGSEIAGPVVGIPTTQYTISETGASGANLANYASSYNCLNGTSSFASGSGTSALLPAFPAASSATGAQIVCTFTNTPASISLTKTPSPTSVSSAGQLVTYT